MNVERAAQRANDPWEDEDASLSELNQLVKQLQKDDPEGESSKKLSAKISDVSKTSEISVTQNGDLAEGELGGKREKNDR